MNELANTIVAAEQRLRELANQMRQAGKDEPADRLRKVATGLSDAIHASMELTRRESELAEAAKRAKERKRGS